MKRKVVKHGPSTYVVSLPSSWVKKLNIKKGDELDVMEREGNLIIGGEMNPTLLEAKVDISNFDRTTIFYVIRGFYRAGYDSLRITFNKQKIPYQREDKELNVLSIIHAEVNRLVGYEVLEEGKNYCLIKDIQETTGKNFDQALRRIFLLMTNAVKEFVQSIKDNNFQYLSIIKDEKHHNITKFISYCLRLINKQTTGNSQEAFYLSTVLFYMENIIDTLRSVSRDLQNYKGDVAEPMNKLLEDLEKSIVLFESFFYRYEEKKAMEINNIRYDVEREIALLTAPIPYEIAKAAQMLYQIFLDIDLMESVTVLKNLKKEMINFH